MGDGAGGSTCHARDSQIGRELGYVEGQNLLVEWRSADGDYDRLSELAAELIRLPVDLIVAEGPATRAAMNVTSVIPIVMVGAQDPVASGWVASLARPGGNVTGPSNITVQLSAKQLQLLQQVTPELSRVAVLWHTLPNSSSGAGPAGLLELQSAAPALGIQLQSLQVADASDFERVFDTAAREHAEALIVRQDAFIASQLPRVVDLGLRSGLPTMYPRRAYVEAGGLMSYGAVEDSARRAAVYVDKILKGARPADLPVEQPTNFNFVINLKTAEALGLTIPQHVLLQATEIIP